MKYIIPENKLDNIVFKYLDTTLKGLEKKKPEYFEGIVIAHPNKDYGILGLTNNDTLHIYHELIDEISEIFGLDRSDSKSIIGRWVSDRYQLKVRNTHIIHLYLRHLLSIDTN